MHKEPVIENPRYRQGIEKITVADATFAKSGSVIEPSWINFFFGNNGCGKTTISRTIRAGGGGIVWGDGKSESDYTRFVYNQDFVKNELRFTEDEDPVMPGVLMLGKEKNALSSQNKVKLPNWKPKLMLS